MHSTAVKPPVRRLLGVDLLRLLGGEAVLKLFAAPAEVAAQELVGFPPLQSLYTRARLDVDNRQGPMLALASCETYLPGLRVQLNHGPVSKLLVQDNRVVRGAVGENLVLHWPIDFNYSGPAHQRRRLHMSQRGSPVDVGATCGNVIKKTTLATVSRTMTKQVKKNVASKPGQSGEQQEVSVHRACVLTNPVYDVQQAASHKTRRIKNGLYGLARLQRSKKLLASKAAKVARLDNVLSETEIRLERIRH